MTQKSPMNPLLKTYLIISAVLVAGGILFYLGFRAEQINDRQFWKRDHREDYAENQQKLKTAIQKRKRDDSTAAIFSSALSKGIVCYKQVIEKSYNKSDTLHPSIEVQKIGDSLFWKDSLGTFSGKIDSIKVRWTDRGNIYLDRGAYRTAIEYKFENGRTTFSHLPNHSGQLFFKRARRKIGFGKSNRYKLDPVFSAPCFKKVLQTKYARKEWLRSRYLRGRSIVGAGTIEKFLRKKHRGIELFVFQTTSGSGKSELFTYMNNRRKKLHSSSGKQDFRPKISGDTLFYTVARDIYVYNLKSGKKVLFDGKKSDIYSEEGRVKRVYAKDNSYSAVYDSHSLSVVKNNRKETEVLESPVSKEWSLGEDVVWNEKSTNLYGTTSGISTGIWQYDRIGGVFTKIVRDVKVDCIQAGDELNEIYYLHRGDIYLAAL